MAIYTLSIYFEFFRTKMRYLKAYLQIFYFLMNIWENMFISLIVSRLIEPVFLDLPRDKSGYL